MRLSVYATRHRNIFYRKYYNDSNKKRFFNINMQTKI